MNSDLPQNFDEIERFLSLFVAIDPDATVGELRARWEEVRDEMRHE